MNGATAGGSAGAAGLRMPAEWAPHERTLLAWPCRDEIWGSQRRQAEADYAEIARTIARFEPVTMVARPEHAEAAAEVCGPTVDVVALPLDDSWIRDSGPIYVIDGAGRRVAVDFRFNGWGKFVPHDADDALTARLAGLRGDERRAVDLVLEGGSITVDGEGTLVATEQCLLHPNRNPARTRADIEGTLRDHLGVTTIVWVPFGLADDDDTDGHVDNVAAFVAPGTVLVQGCSDPDEADHDRLAIDRRCLDGALDAAGRPLAVVDVPVLPFTVIDGERRPVPYLNLYLCNGAVVVPVCGHPADADMLALVGSVLPGREVVGVPGAVLALGGGGPHCITQQVPAARMGPCE